MFPAWLGRADAVSARGVLLSQRPDRLGRPSRRWAKFRSAAPMPLGYFALAAACAFVGAALYINLVEQPARLSLAPRAMMHEWTPSNRRGFVLMSALAIISSVLAYADYARTGDARWLIGGTIILASLPYAYFVIMPVNIELYALER